MAGYRPKSLDELNSMYDQTRAAEKAIRKGTSLLSSEEFSKPTDKELDAIKKKEKELLDALENSYNFNTFLEKKTEEETNPIETEETSEKEEKAEIQLNQNEDVSPKKPVITQVIDPVITDTADEDIIVSPANEQPAPEQEPQEIAAEAEVQTEAEIEAEAEEEAEVSVQPVEEAEEKQEPAAVIIHQADFAASTVRTDLIDDYKKIMNDEEDDEEEPVKEKKLSRKEKKKRKKQQAAEKAAKENKEQDNQKTSETAENENESLEDQPFAEVKEYNPEDSEPVFEEDVFEDLVTPSKERSFTVEETIEEHDDFDFPENYEPEWIENDKAEDLKQAEEKENKKDKTQKKSGATLAKSILVLILAIVVFMAFVATTLKSVIAVNTGTPFRENYYAFTAYTDYETAGILEGDLVITEKVYAEDGDVFAYINYNEKTFEFAKRTRSILNNDEVLIVAVNGDERTLISRDDCRGVVYATYSGIGKYIALITDNYIIVMAVLVVIALGVCLALIFGFKGNKKDNKKKKTEKPVTLTVTDEEEVNLFETIG